MSFRIPFEHHDALLAAAIDAFVANGYEGASLNAILAAAGMSKGQFYHHFADKQALYLAVCEALIDRKRTHFAAHPVPSAADPFEGLAASLRAGWAFARAHPDLEAFGRAYLRERGRPIFDVVTRAFPLGADPGLERTVADGFAQGAFAADLTPGFVARAIGVVLAGAGDLLDAADPERGLEELVTFLRRGLGPTRAG